MFVGSIGVPSVPPRVAISREKGGVVAPLSIDHWKEAVEVARLTPRGFVRA